MQQERSGRIPDFSRTRRREPVQRSEVRAVFYWWSGQIGWDIQTMPAGTYRLDSAQQRWEHITELWQPLLDELVADYYTRVRQRNRSLPNLAVVRVDFRIERAREYTCVECGSIFLAQQMLVHSWLVCSDACAQRHYKTDANTRYYRRRTQGALFNVARTQRRALARANRHCEQCNKLMKPERRTKRYCSNACRLAAHRRKRARSPSGAARSPSGQNAEEVQQS
jgi:ferredoxin